MCLKEMYYNISIFFVLLTISSSFTISNNIDDKNDSDMMRNFAKLNKIKDNNKIVLTLQIENPTVREDITDVTTGSNGINSFVDACQFLVGISKGNYCPTTETKDPNLNIPGSCQEIYKNGNTMSGTYQILPSGQTKPLMVLCDMEIQGGGWTHIQKRFDGSEDFYRPWRDYKFGFGNLKGEFWLGLENIHQLTSSETNELLIELTDHNMLNYYARFLVFKVGPEYDGYELKTVDGYRGNATTTADDCMKWHEGQKFTTFDQDHDRWNEGNCANFSRGAWWYNNCYCSNLNGTPRNMPHTNILRPGMNWDRITLTQKKYLYGTRMLIRPKL
ncbi:microfibril-associated glycoprotein 4-like [Diabrotica undecimpunctata]|uniref:microfibril-associated glycoprotein 4-like n=1 Tax=Diabrotica undecimpunctata TaxID=50387 RepID=UPI003B63C74D